MIIKFLFQIGFSWLHSLKQVYMLSESLQMFQKSKMWIVWISIRCDFLLTNLQMLCLQSRGFWNLHCFHVPFKIFRKFGGKFWKFLETVFTESANML